MRGVWLTRSAAALANGKGMFVFNRDVVPKLKMKKKSPKSHPLVFLPEDMMLEPYKETYKDNFVEEDEFSAQVEDVLGDVTQLGEVQFTDTNSELTAARLENIKMRTLTLQERLNERKEQLFEEWSEKFYEVFSESFAKFKNNIINMRLDDEQLKEFNASLDSAILCLADRLSEIWKGFIENSADDKNA